MFAVVGCGECDALWVVEGRPATTGCPRCGTRHRFDRLRRLAESESEDAARGARAAILAERSGHGDAFAELDPDELDDAAEAPVVDDEEYLGAAGLDVGALEAAGEAVTRGDRAGHGSPMAVVRAALGELDAPTREGVLDYAAERDVARETAAQLLSRLVDAGDVTADGDRLRLL